ncbi:hypothetical protein KKB69_00990 [Patescibacteria group bacterium]|nr:hypothetical protein [Patescibacteria group bacterium]
MRNTFLILFFVLVGLAMSAGFALASSTSGAIDSTGKYAWMVQGLGLNPLKKE